MANYLYNGVELPALPEWDKSAYPYALILYTPIFGIAQWTLYVGSEIIYRQVTSGYQVGFSTCKTWTTSGKVWSARDDNAEETYIVSVGSSSLKWANFDVLNDDGSVYLAASDPIPVNPAPTLDPTALLMGWQVGNRIRHGNYDT